MKNHWFSEVFYYFHKLLKMHGNLPRMLPKSSLEASKTSQNPPKRLPRRHMMGPKGAQETPKPFQDAPLQVPPKMPPRPLRDAQNASKSAQEAPKLPQEPPNTPLSRFAARFLEVSGPPILTKIFENGFANSNLFDVNTLVQV